MNLCGRQTEEKGEEGGRSVSYLLDFNSIGTSMKYNVRQVAGHSLR